MSHIFECERTREYLDKLSIIVGTVVLYFRGLRGPLLLNVQRGLTARIDAAKTIYSVNSVLTNVSLLNILGSLGKLEKLSSWTRYIGFAVVMNVQVRKTLKEL